MGIGEPIRSRLFKREYVSLLMLVILLSERSNAVTGKPEVLVVYTSRVEAYMEAVEGIVAALDRGSLRRRLVDLGTASALADLDAAMAGARVVIAVGAQAVEETSGRKSVAPIVSTMILRSDHPREPNGRSHPRGAAVYIDVRMAGILTELRRTFPGKTRLGVIRNPALPSQDRSALEKQILADGFTPEVLDCPGPEQLSYVLGLFKGRVDFVLLYPDTSLYNSTTVKPLILDALSRRLPIIGYSGSFVRAGAAVGIYPDFREVGHQAADLALRFLNGETPASEGPRKLIVAVNHRMMRLLDLEPSSRRDAGLMVFR